MRDELKKLNVKRWDIGRCSNRGLTKYIYRLPIKLEINILEVLKPLGKQVYSFPKLS